MEKFFNDNNILYTIEKVVKSATERKHFLKRRLRLLPLKN